jgi:hypothetical protein
VSRLYQWQRPTQKDCTIKRFRTTLAERNSILVPTNSIYSLAQLHSATGWYVAYMTRREWSEQDEISGIALYPLYIALYIKLENAITPM